MAECDFTGDTDYSDTITDIYVSGMQRMSNNLLHGSLSFEDWVSGMQDAIELMYVRQAIAGVGGDESQITASDRARIQANIATQYAYLDGFASKIEKKIDEDGASLEFIGKQAEMYAKSSRTEFWRQATSGVDLPTMPGEQKCLGNCGCSWECRDGDWYWVRGKTDSCQDCIDNEKEYNPYEG